MFETAAAVDNGLLAVSRRSYLAALGLAAMVLVAAGDARGQEALASDLTVTPLWDTGRFLGGRTTLELELSRALGSPGERLAVMVASLDVSALVEVRGTRVRYRPTAARLPSGESEIVAYRVDRDGEWAEIGRMPLKILTRAGLEAGSLLPSADLSSSGQLDQSATEPGLPARGAYQDLTLNLGLQGQAARAGWLLGLEASALGVSEDAQRLRWGELGADAPAIDLANYRVQVGREGAGLTLGSVTAGRNRHLLDGFGSRGVAGSVALAPFATIDAAVVNGTSVVGWGNLLGLAASPHRISSAGLSLELQPSRPGAVHVDVSGLDASVLPLTSYTQGAVTDAEESRGVGVQFSATDAAQRIRVAAGIARSRFVNPADALLAGDTIVVAVQPTTRTARYGELGLQLLQNATLSAAMPVNLAAAVRHERVDPLYRSIGAYVAADQERNGLDLTGSLGALSMQAALSSGRDNLANLASILTTRTRSKALNAALPLGSLVRAPAGRWYWPQLSWSWQRIRQFGEGIPVGGDFSASHVPDQASTNHTAAMAWTATRWTLGYRWNQSFQDNRQPGREQADFRSKVHGVSLSITASPRVSVTGDLSVERQQSIETAATQRLERVGASLQWQLTRATAMSGNLSQSWGLDPASERRTRNTEYQVELSQGFNLYRHPDFGTQGRLFVRYLRSRAATLPLTSTPLLDQRIVWTLNAGASLRLY